MGKKGNKREEINLVEKAQRRKESYLKDWQRAYKKAICFTPGVNYKGTEGGVLKRIYESFELMEETWSGKRHLVPDHTERFQMSVDQFRKFQGEQLTSIQDKLKEFLETPISDMGGSLRVYFEYATRYNNYEVEIFHFRLVDGVNDIDEYRMALRRFNIEHDYANDKEYIEGVVGFGSFDMMYTKEDIMKISNFVPEDKSYAYGSWERLWCGEEDY